MFRSRAVLVFLCSIFGFAAAQAQTIPLTGRVVSAAGQPVPGAEVAIQPSAGAVSAPVAEATGRVAFGCH